MADIDAATNRNRHAKEWLQDRARQLNNADWLPLSVREHFARDVPELVEDIKRLRRANDILSKWYLASEQDRVAAQAIVDAATAWYRSTPDAQDRRDTETIAIAAYEYLSRHGFRHVVEVPQLPWKGLAGEESYTEVSFRVHSVTGDIAVEDTTVSPRHGSRSSTIEMSPELAIEKGLALLRAGLQAKVLSTSPTDPEIEDTP